LSTRLSFGHFAQDAKCDRSSSTSDFQPWTLPKSPALFQTGANPRTNHTNTPFSSVSLARLTQTLKLPFRAWTSSKAAFLDINPLPRENKNRLRSGQDLVEPGRLVGFFSRVFGFGKHKLASAHRAQTDSLSLKPWNARRRLSVMGMNFPSQY
jgi:hypothetical protein